MSPIGFAYASQVLNVLTLIPFGRSNRLPQAIWNPPVPFTTWTILAMMVGLFGIPLQASYPNLN